MVFPKCEPGKKKKRANKRREIKPHTFTRQPPCHLRAIPLVWIHAFLGNPILDHSRRFVRVGIGVVVVSPLHLRQVEDAEPLWPEIPRQQFEFKVRWQSTNGNHLATRRVARDVASVKASGIGGLVVGFVPDERGEGKHPNLIEVDLSLRDGLEEIICGEDGAAVKENLGESCKLQREYRAQEGSYLVRPIVTWNSDRARTSTWCRYRSSS